MQDLSGFLSQNGLKFGVEVYSAGLFNSSSCNHHDTNRLNILTVQLYNNLVMAETFLASLQVNEVFPAVSSASSPPDEPGDH